jgi:hypothetical protein
MAYHVEIDEVLVLGYLRHQDRHLTDADVDRLLDFLGQLADTGDLYRSNPSYRHPSGAPLLDIQFVFQDASGRVRCFRFIVSDAAATYGVLRVRFAEELW